ncbi:MAG: DICT sensory domain-containing protein [Cyanobacteria bacterium]|nr:DICT sensory domain-containing protein [Cyanobacteriota bacterium]MDA0866585.1 DICT sensory domain-containing protein [Cyanobacteriota bacterium]
MRDGSILQKLVQAQNPAISAESPINFGVYYKNTLVALCHALEDCILAADCKPLVIAAFQQGKWYLQEADRYGAIAEQAEQVVIMAAPDAGFHSHATSQRPNVALVDLAPADPVAQEWHLIILSPQYTAMVLCQELTDADYGSQGVPSHDLERKFYGLWTFEPTLVGQTMDHIIQHLGQYDPDLQTLCQQQRDAILAANPTLSEATSTQALSRVVTRVLDYLQDSETDGEAAFATPKDLHHNLLSNELQAMLRMAQLADAMDPVNPLAATKVVALLEMMGQLADLPAWRLQRLRLAGWLYRIAPLQAEALPQTEAPSCPLVPGAQVLRRMPQLRAIAQIITHQTEYWDGSGQPAGLAGDQIPLESRMLSLVSYFQQQVASLSPDAEDRDAAIEQVLATCQQTQGERWDPKLVDILSLMVKGLQQGLSLPTIPLKVSLGAGLLNPEVDTWDRVAASTSTSSVS